MSVRGYVRGGEEESHIGSTHSFPLSTQVTATLQVRHPKTCKVDVQNLTMTDASNQNVWFQTMPLYAVLPALPRPDAFRHL